MGPGKPKIPSGSNPTAHTFFWSNIMVNCEKELAEFELWIAKRELKLFFILPMLYGSFIIILIDVIGILVRAFKGI